MPFGIRRMGTHGWASEFVGESRNSSARPPGEDEDEVTLFRNLEHWTSRLY